MSKKANVQTICCEQEQLKKYKQLLELLPNLASSIEREEKIVVQEVNNLLEADHTHIRVINWLKQELNLVEYAEENSEEIPLLPEFKSVSINKGIAGQIFRDAAKGTITKGQIFNCVQDNNKDFKKYLKGIKTKKLRIYLKRYEHVIAVPLFLDKKIIGVLITVRLKNNETTTKPAYFTDNDLDILDSLAQYASIALRNRWLFQSALWQPDTSDFSEDEFKASLTIKNLCNEINADNYNISIDAPVNTLERLNEFLKHTEFYAKWCKKHKKSSSSSINDLVTETTEYRKKSFFSLTSNEQSKIKRLNRLLLEETYPQTCPKNHEKQISVKNICEEVARKACEVTGATDCRIRFVDWHLDQKEIRLVPGVVKKLDDDKASTEKSEKDRSVYVRKMGECCAGKAAKTQKPYPSDLSIRLKDDPVFDQFFNNAKTQEIFYKNQLNTLTQWQIIIQNNRTNVAKIWAHIKNDIKNLKPSEAKPVLQTRYEALKNKAENYEELKDLCEKQVKFVTLLATAWSEYIYYLDAQLSEIAVPIQVGEKLLGVINVHVKEENWFTKSDEAILCALAGRIATAIMGHQQRILDAVQEIEQKITASETFGSIADSIDEGIKNLAFLGDNKKIFPLLYTCEKPTSSKELLDEPDNFGGEFKYREGRHIADNSDQSEYFNTMNELSGILIRNDGLGWEAIKELKEKHKEELKEKHKEEPVFIVREFVDDPISGGSESAQKYNIRTTACLPLAFEGTVYGLLYIHIKDERYFFTRLERNTLTSFAAQAAIALKNLISVATYESLKSNQLIDDCIKVS